MTLSRDGRSLYVAATSDAAIARFLRNPRTGRIRFGGCITGETESGPGGSKACRRIQGIQPAGDGSGLDDARGLALSPDGAWLYGVASDDDAIFRFKRSRRRGSLDFRGCVSGDSDVACRDAPVTAPGGGNTGFDDLRGLAMTRDGRSVYVTSRGDDGVLEFRRSLRTGRLSYTRCHSGDLEAAAGDPCRSAGIPAPLGEDSGMDATEGIVASRDGRSVYVSTANDASVVEFKRKRRNGRLTFRTCDTGDFDAGQLGSSACRSLMVANVEGDSTGIDFPAFMALGPDDRSLYVASGGDDAVFTFSRER
jgi:6-phosphogluconolactonase (cycloisomerase 2 family)